MYSRRLMLTAAIMSVSLSFVVAGSAQTEPVYGPGTSKTEIKIGQTMSYSGAAATYGTFGRVMTAYFKELNERGGINGRKINLISVDDGFSPPKTVEMTRRLVEADGVAFICCSMGTGPNASVQKYLNDKKIPQIFVNSGATRFADGSKWPWTTGMTPTYKDEGRNAARFILKNKPGAKIALLFQNDDSGRDTLDGFKDELGKERAAKMIVSELSYEPTDATVDSQIRQAKASGADTFFENTAAKYTAQAIRIAADIGWKPLHIVMNNSSSISQVIEPAGYENSQGLVAGKFMKEPTDPAWASDAKMEEWRNWMKKHYPEGHLSDQYNVQAYMVAQALEQVIKAAGDELTRENFLKQALSINIDTPFLLPGLKLQTSQTNRSAISQMRYYRFEGKQWVPMPE